jgi:hypothetical protein
MRREDKIDDLMNRHKPQRRNFGEYGEASRESSGVQPNKERSIADRMQVAFTDCRHHMYFLTGMMHVMPKGTPMEVEAERLLLRGLDLLNSKNWSPAVIRQISRHGEKIVKLMKKIRHHTKQLDDNVASALPKK